MEKLLASVPVERSILEENDGMARSVPFYLYVLHTTGAGIVQKALDSGIRRENATAIARYAARFYAAKNAVSTHLLIDWLGNTWQTCRLTWDAWHSGYEDRARDLYYAPNDGWRRWSRPIGFATANVAPEGEYEGWRMNHPGLRSPVEMLSAEVRRKRGSPNLGSISIDLLATIGGAPWPEAQLQGLRRTLLELGEHTGVQPTPANVRTHSELDPIARGSVKKSGHVIERAWDPEGVNVARLLAA